jgi:hypothetical protein
MRIKKFEQINEALVRGGSPDERAIDLRGPGGNAFNILGMASNLCNQLKEVDPDKYDWERIKKEMESGDYKNLVNTFEEYFGDYVTIYNADVLDESMINEEFKNPFKKKVESQPEPELPKEEFGGDKPKRVQPEEGYDLERFYSAIEKLHKKGQESRKNNLSRTFFRKFIGKELMGSEIKDILVDVITQNDMYGNMYGMSIVLDNGTKVYYNFSKDKVSRGDNISIDPFLDYTRLNKEIEEDTSMPNNQKGQIIQRKKEELKKDAKKVSRKDARLIGQIAKRFNPDTKYAVGTGDLIIKEYESRIIKFKDYLNE